MNDRKIVVLLGGDSPEREVSLVTGAQVAAGLRECGYRVVEVDPAGTPLDELLISLKKQAPYIIFNALHGGSGEDGHLAAALELCHLPFTGSGSAAGAFGMDKHVSHLLAAHTGCHVPATRLLYAGDSYNTQSLINELGSPLVVKPNDTGSSVGVYICQTAAEVEAAIAAGWRISRLVLAQQFIPGRELTVSVLGGKALPVVEIKPHEGFYDYTNKYTKGRTTYEAPAQIPADVAEIISRQAEAVFLAVGCKAYARVDFRWDGEKAWFLEINTLPGMTALSLTPMAAKAAGLSFIDLLGKIVELSLV